MESNLKKEIKSTGLGFLLIWLLTFVSGAYFAWFMRKDYEIESVSDMQSQGFMLLAIQWLLFIASIAAIVFGLLKARKLHTALKQHQVEGGKWLIYSIAVLSVTLLLSLQSLEGCNITFLVMVLGESTIWGKLSVVAMIIWWCFPVFQHIGISAIAEGKYGEYNAISSFRELKKYSMAIMVISFIFSPLLMGYINADTKTFEHTLTFNIIAAIVLLTSIILYYMAWNKAVEGEIVVPEKVEMTEVTPAVDRILASVRKAYLFTGISIVVSLCVLYFQFSTYSRGAVYMFLMLAAYVVGWYGIVTGVKASLSLKKLVPAKINPGSTAVLASFIVLCVTSFLSFSSIIGVNIYNYYVNRVSDFKEYLDLFSEIDRMREFMAMLSGISMMLFVFYGVFVLCGTIHLSKIFPELKKSIIWAVGILVLTLLLAPLFIITEVYESEVVYLLGFVIYLAVSVMYALSWKNFTTMVKLPGETPEECDDKLLATVKKDKRVAGVAALASVAILISAAIYTSILVDTIKHSSPKDVEIVDAEALEAEVREIYSNIESSVSDKHNEAVEETEEDINANTKVLRNLYNNIVLNLSMADDEWTESFIQQHLSPELRKRLMDDYDFDDGGYAWWTLKSWEKKYTSNYSELTGIESLGDGWYRVRYIDNGVKDYKDLRVVKGVVMEYKDSPDYNRKY